MTVKKDAVVEMHYTLKNDAGDVIDSSEGKEPMPFMHGRGHIISGLEKAVEGMKVGESCDVSLAPADAYGAYDKEAIQEIPMEALKGIDKLEVGMDLQSQDQQGNPVTVNVVKINKESITIDANHPLAGETLHFNLRIESVREATKEELDHGHVHSDSCSH
ncbi:MAG TPA: peptidylprolyl isomerase [Gammaproteobacteria bacterium]|nr:peptidylprolyl isomerase [Gammaproteobacteria bacterium]